MKANQTQRTGANGKSAGVHTQAGKPTAAAAVLQFIGSDGAEVAKVELDAREFAALEKGARVAGRDLQQFVYEGIQEKPSQLEAQLGGAEKDVEFQALSELETGIWEVKALHAASVLSKESGGTPDPEIVAGLQSLGFTVENRLQSAFDALWTARHARGAINRQGGVR